jgi:putative DNA primase/helicase
MNHLQQFADAIAHAGLTPPGVIHDDGEIHRFPTNHRQNDDAGWYVLHSDGIPAGAFGDWRTGLWDRWRADIGRKLTRPEEAVLLDRITRAKSRADDERQREAEVAAKRATSIWESAAAAPSDHAYLVAKGIGPHGLRLYRGEEFAIRGMKCDGALILAAHNAEGQIQSVQFVSAEGDKRFLPGGKKSGTFYLIGELRGVLCIAEGFATGASIHQCSGHAVAVAFDAGNLEPVARVMRQKHPAVRIIICADNDESGTGQKSAEVAARAVDALIALPEETGADWNDVHLARGADAVQRGIDAARRMQGGASGLLVRRMSDIEARPVHWLWPGRIARGKLSVIAGNPGLGKSQICASLSAIVTTGGEWPVDRSRCEAGAVLLLSAEDDAADTMRPRLEAAHADLARVHVLDAVEDMEYGRTIRRGFDLGADLERLAAELDRHGDVALIVIDPITAYMGGIDGHKTTEVRGLLAPLQSLAAEKAIAIVAVTHMRKNMGGDPMMQITGSMGLIAAARGGFVVAKDRDDPARRLMLPVKNNIGNDSTGYAFRVGSIALPNGISTSRVEWEQEYVTTTADEAMAPGPANEGPRSAVESAAEFLRALLGDGPVPSSRVYEEARQVGHADTTIKRAQQALGIKSRKGGMKDGWLWELPPKKTKVTEEGQAQNMAAFGEVDHLRIQDG